MVSFSSSVIKKGSKKFAPRAPVRRGPAGAGAGAGGAAATPAPSTAKKPSTAPRPQQRPQPQPQPQPQSQPSTQPQTATQAQQPEEHAPTTEGAATAASPTPRGEDHIATPAPVPEGVDATSTATSAYAAPTGTTAGTATPISIPKPQAIPVPTPTAAPIPISTPISRPSAQPTPIAPPRPQAQAQQQDISPVVPSVGTTGAEDFPEERPAKRARVEQAGPAPTTIPAPQSVAEPASATPQQSSSGGIQVVIPTRPPAQARAAPKKPATTRRAPQQRRQPPARTASATEGGDGTTTPSGRPRGRRRAATPENAADIEVEPGVVKMSDICKDPRTGRTSRREMELRKLDHKKKEEGNAVTTSTETETETPKDGEAAAEGARRAKEGERSGQENEDRPSSSGAGPGFRIVNGEIVIDNESLQIDRQADAARDAGELEEVVESDLTRRINYASFGKRTKAESWDEALTDLFYRGLRMFGTDFMMISKMFPGRNRRQIKLKFSNEERKNPLRIKETLLGPREVVSLEDYSEMTRTVYEDPKVVQAELDEERRKIEEDHHKERVAREENLRQSGADKAVPSVEGRGRGAAALRARFGGKKFGMGAAKYGGGGGEEILGTID